MTGFKPTREFLNRVIKKGLPEIDKKRIKSFIEGSIEIENKNGIYFLSFSDSIGKIADMEMPSIENGNTLSIVGLKILNELKFE